MRDWSCHGWDKSKSPLDNLGLLATLVSKLLSCGTIFRFQSLFQSRLKTFLKDKAYTREITFLVNWPSPHLSDDFPPLGQGRSRGLSSRSPAPTDLVVVDRDVQVSRHTPVEPGRNRPARSKTHVGHSQLSGSWRVGRIWGWEDVVNIQPE